MKTITYDKNLYLAERHPTHHRKNRTMGKKFNWKD